MGFLPRRYPLGVPGDLDWKQARDGPMISLPAQVHEKLPSRYPYVFTVESGAGLSELEIRACLNLSMWSALA